MIQKAMFGAGCFWGVQSKFDAIKGVVKTHVGYSGGKTKNPTYDDVCEGDTEHAEVILIEFDSSKVSYEHLLEIFWKLHDPTQMNRQGPDIGDQYRSVVFYFSAEQRKIAEKSKQNVQKNFSKKIATIIEPVKEFYKAEEYHQKYNEKNGNVCY
ncbi:MAG: peptide-methionine (S)-S-oxide reductase MsrA [Candidatus Aenigmarchaeota archaeon]|nr:peptide-methionine (S)-S-oxide reductase MsrA [Candidatus Aenigmarchaeota archaeon]